MSVSWEEFTQALSEVGLLLPSSAQWEYAARASTQSPWWTGDTKDSLQGAENIRDQSGDGIMRGNDGELTTEFEEWNDGYPFHAPVGSFRPNPFGLYDVNGNAFEWCRDELDNSETRVLRGGGCFVLADTARVSIEWSRKPSFRGGHLGARPAIELVGKPTRCKW